MSHLTILSFGRVDHPPAFMIFDRIARARSRSSSSVIVSTCGDTMWRLRRQALRPSQARIPDPPPSLGMHPGSFEHAAYSQGRAV